MKLNNVSLVDRHNRPTVIQKVALRTFFVNDGMYFDPAVVSGVTVFSKTDSFTPGSVLDGNVISSNLDTSLIKMHFGVSAGVSPGNVAHPISDFNPDTDPGSLSAIYRIGVGDYVCVLEGGTTQAGYYDFHGASEVITNSADAVLDYIDAWTIKVASNSEFQTLINDFRLYDDTFFSTTQKILLKASNRLLNKKVTLGSITNMKIATDIIIQNRDIDDSIKNLFKDSAIINASVQIDKINEEGSQLPGYLTIKSFANTAPMTEITSDNTILYKFDTTSLVTTENVASFGGVVGTYRITAKYTLLDETIVTPPYFFTIS